MHCGKDRERVTERSTIGTECNTNTRSQKEKVAKVLAHICG